MMCCLPSIVPEDPTPQASTLFRILKILSVVQLAFGIFNLFISISSGVYIMIGALLLYMIPCGRNWCTCVIYIVLCLMDLIQTGMLLGVFFAKNTRIDSQIGIFLFIDMFKLPLYMITVYYSFLAYRELKAIVLEMQYGDGLPSNPQNPSVNQPFSGTGYVIK